MSWDLLQSVASAACHDRLCHQLSLPLIKAVNKPSQAASLALSGWRMSILVWLCMRLCFFGVFLLASAARYRGFSNFVADMKEQSKSKQGFFFFLIDRDTVRWINGSFFAAFKCRLIEHCNDSASRHASKSFHIRYFKRFCVSWGFSDAR